jgi:hypothetical protein
MVVQAYNPSFWETAMVLDEFLIQVLDHCPLYSVRLHFLRNLNF